MDIPAIGLRPYNSHIERSEYRSLIFMKIANDSLPSNRKFGLFFAVVFLLATAYLYSEGATFWVYVVGAVSLGFFATAILQPNKLGSLNRLWMRVGLVLGSIVSPVVMGVMFFCVFFPLAVWMRLLGRDELRLRKPKRSSYWEKREQKMRSEFFKEQF